ncbi:DUF262 domain-containing protein [Flavobacterium hauense]
MNETKQNSETISFLKLLSQQSKIEIPIIQRDYAQGRKDKKEIRENFLNALYESLVANKAIKLDFIYGSKVDNVFLPLDGQQRLTTLFLLHWYASIKDNTETQKKEILRKFGYETRITSREFCEALVLSDITVEENLIISDQIKDSKWFFMYWVNDPTIESMLRTIDSIHAKFFTVDNLWAKLETNLINFYYVELDNIGLSDDLYIKMNARGKLLSPFENFKASLEKHINENDWEANNMAFQDTFAFKIDTEWTDFFWLNFKKNNKIDIALMRFISTIVMIRQSVERISNRITIILSLHDNPDKVRPIYMTKSGFEYLTKCFEVYSKNYNKLNLVIDFDLWRHKPKSDFLREISFEDNLFSSQINSSSYTQKVLFYAQTEYLIRNEYNQEKYLDWMRVVRNIVSRGSVIKGGKRPDIIRSPEAFDGVIYLISEIAVGSGDIYEYLSKVEKLTSAFAKEQLDEEKSKSKLIVSNTSNRDAILQMENLPLFKGRIDFAFYCLGYDYNPESFDLVGFKEIYNVLYENFGDDSSDNISNDIRRALLTINHNDKYDFYDYWSSYWYVGDAAKRCLLENYRELEYYIYYTDQKIYLKKLINKLQISTLQDIITDFVAPVGFPNWKLRLIKEKDLLDKKSKSNYIAISNNNSSCYLLKSKRPRDLEGCEKIK